MRVILKIIMPAVEVQWHLFEFITGSKMGKFFFFFIIIYGKAFEAVLEVFDIVNVWILF